MALLFHNKNTAHPVEARIASSLRPFRFECIREAGCVPVKITDVQYLVPLYQWLLESTCSFQSLLRYYNLIATDLTALAVDVRGQTNRTTDRQRDTYPVVSCGPVCADSADWFHIAECETLNGQTGSHPEKLYAHGSSAHTHRCRGRRIKEFAHFKFAHKEEILEWIFGNCKIQVAVV